MAAFDCMDRYSDRSQKNGAEIREKVEILKSDGGRPAMVLHVCNGAEEPTVPEVLQGRETDMVEGLEHFDERAGVFAL